jgi:hypothetical protein
MPLRPFRVVDVVDCRNRSVDGRLRFSCLLSQKQGLHHGRPRRETNRGAIVDDQFSGLKAGYTLVSEDKPEARQLRRQREVEQRKQQFERFTDRAIANLIRRTLKAFGREPQSDRQQVTRTLDPMIIGYGDAVRSRATR